MSNTERPALGKRRVIPKKGLRLICCDCGLSHAFRFETPGKRLYMTRLARRKTGHPIRAQIIKGIRLSKESFWHERSPPPVCRCQGGPAADSISIHNFIETARTVAAICATRALLMIAVLTGAAIWGFTVWRPHSTCGSTQPSHFPSFFVGPLAASFT